MILRARFVLPVEGVPIADGEVAVEAGRIVRVGSASGTRSGEVTDFGEAVILPGLVNAHTHLELSHLAGAVPPSSDFTAWLRALVGALRTRSGDSEWVKSAVCRGISESLAGGVTTVGDITRHPDWTRAVLAASPLRAVSFGEVIAIGTGRGKLHAQIEAAASTEWRSDRLRCGLSPHAPYTVEPEGMRACARHCAADGAPLCMHLAETQDEVTFTRGRGGALAEFLKWTGAWDDHIPTSGCGPVVLADRAGSLTPRTVLAHANYVTDDDIALIAERGASVAYCPRTHAAFGHASHRFRDMLEAGVNVCLGTDSLASNPSLSLLDEMRYLRAAAPDLDPALIVNMATINGAEALGSQQEIGSIVPGKAADLVAIPLKPRADRWESFLDGDDGPVSVYAAGERVVT